MKKAPMLLITMLLACASISTQVSASDIGSHYTNRGVTYYNMEATAYCINGKTATGTHTRKGICAADPDHFGQVACVYKNENGKAGEFIGYFECQDTGGSAIRSGKVVDIWLPTYDDCIQFGRKSVFVVWVDGVG